MKVLDLAAAPGGKSTQLAAYLAGEGLLIPMKFQVSEQKYWLKIWNVLVRQMLL